MAVLVALGGAALGSALGIGANVGWIIGSVVGALLFPPAGTDVTHEGPRLGDLSVTSSAYGASIPIMYGTVRAAGNIIWSTGIEERKNVHKQKQGGKGGLMGGGSTTTTITYNYYATFALAIGEGEADDLLRMWADGKLIYDKTGDGDDIIKKGLKFRFYRGDETQQPDGLYEDDKGEGATPAHRGLCYVVFDRLPLKDFGNRIPNITCEITFNQADNKTTTTADLFTVGEGGACTSMLEDQMAPDFTRGVFYTSQSSATVGQNYIRRINTRTMTEDRQVQLSTDALSNDVKFLQVFGVSPEGYILALTAGGNTSPISLINPDSLQITSTFGVSGSGLGNDDAGFEALGAGKVSWIQLLGPNGAEYYALTGSVFNSAGVLNCTGGTLAYCWDSDNAVGEPAVPIDANDRVLVTCPGAIGENFGEGYIAAGPIYGVSDQPDSIYIYKVTVNAGASGTNDLHVGTTYSMVGSGYSPNLLIPGELELEGIGGMFYDQTDDTIMIQAQGASDSEAWMIKIHPTTGSILWRTNINAMVVETQGKNHSRLTDGIYAQADTGGDVWAMYTATGEVYYESTGWTPSAIGSNAGWWDSKTNTILHGSGSDSLTKYTLFRGAGGGATLDTIVDDLCNRAGLADADIDVTDLASITVPGYTLGRSTPVRAAIQPLATVFNFDGVESDYTLKFLLRDGKTSQVSITQEDLALMGGNRYFSENRIQEVELPLRLSLTYMDKDNDYLQAVHNAKRILEPVASMESRNELNIAIPAALDVTTAKQSAESILYSAWIERSNYKFQLPWDYIALDPTDIATLTLDNGTIFRTRLIQTDVGAPSYGIDITALSNEAAQYTSTVTGDGGDSGLDNEFLSVAISKLIFLCSPLLRDSDDVGRTASLVYYFMGGYGQPGWTNAALYKSIEGTEYTPTGVILNEMAWGSAANALGDVSDPFSTDETNSLTVYMVTGADELESITQLEMVNGANPAALITPTGDVEIIQYRDVVTNGDGSLTLTGLLRGRRGTEVNTGGHGVGDTFLLLDAEEGEVLPLALDEIDATRYYKPVTNGQLIDEAITTTKASPGNDLKPYAVVSHKGVVDGSNNIDFTWERRTRVGGSLKDGTGDVPLAEDTEEYELEIFDGPGGTEVREVTGLTSASYQYTAANQNSDGFTAGSETHMTVKIYQISAQVGRGFVQEVTIELE